MTAAAGVAIALSSPTVRSAAMPAAATAAVAAWAWRAGRTGGKVPVPVWLLIAGLAANAVGEALLSLWPLATGRDAPFPGPADVAYLVFYVLMALALTGIVRRRARRIDLGDVLDAAVMTVGVGVAIWELVVIPVASDPSLTAAGRTVSLLYPGADLVLLIPTVALVLTGLGHNAALRRLVVFLGLLLVADVAYLSMQSSGDYQAGASTDLLYLLAYLVLAAAAVHPSAANLLGQGGPGAPRLQRRRLVLLTAAALLPPLVDAARSEGGPTVAQAASVGLFLLVMARVANLLRRLERSGERRFQSLVQQSSEMVLVVDAAGAITYHTVAAARSLGLGDELEDRIGIAWLAHPHDREALQAALAEAAAGPAGVVIHTEARLRSARGTHRATALTLTNLLADRDVHGIVVNAHDVHELRTLASYDSLTGLANRSRFTQALSAAVANPGTGEYAVVLVDLDGFKEINDSLGHDAGDRVLVEVARRLGSAAAGPGGLVARLGGDEFGILCRACGDPARALDMAGRLVAAVEGPIELGPLTVSVGSSAGVVTSRPDHRCAEDLLREADLAMYAAKDHGRGRAVAYEPVMGRQAVQRLELRSALEGALSDGQLELHYQPTFRLADGVLEGFEALLRWRHPRLGMVPPAEFIPAAEQSNLIVTIGRWVLDAAVDQLACWQLDAGGAVRLTMAVNISPRQLADPELVGWVRRALSRTGVDPGQLCLEITEGALVAQPHAAVEVLEQLRRLGVRLAIDDYGSGNASINYLRRFPVDVLKIDRSLVDAIFADEGVSMAFVQTITDLAAILELRTVAEGIEDARQLEAVTALRCEIGQGYHLARPMDAAAAARLVRQRAEFDLSSARHR